MSEPLRVLLLEDSDDDAMIVVRELRKVAPESEVRRVDSGPEFLDALKSFKPQLILSDHRLAGFSGMHALEAARERVPDTPFIFVTGSLDEETAAECVKAGAWDYVLKDKLVRLSSAVKAALELRRTRDALKRSEEQLLHTQKMDALGRLAGGVAHDYNNLMSAIIGYCFLLDRSMPEGDTRHADLLEIRQAAERAGALTHQLLAFSRKQVIEFKTILLNDVIANMERLLKRLIGERVTIVTALAPRLSAIRSDTSQLEQVIVNLVVNARDAMPGGGKVTIETQDVALDESHREEHPDSGVGAHVQLRVSDSGTGMDAATVAQIFEPFFTTKPRGQGTGLGLATVYGIVRQSGGHIEVASAPGEGTTFTIYFPATQIPRSTDPRPQTTREPKLAGTETILLVEDDAPLRALARRVLSSYGYRVLDAATASDAHGLLAVTPRIDLLLADVVMPEETGPELADAITRDHPHVRVILMSGYTDDIGEHVDRASPERPYIQKPFDPVALVRKVRETLDGN
jgi:two-component system cell cycle sensor histidine kinase/response regulator CckA